MSPPWPFMVGTAAFSWSLPMSVEFQSLLNAAEVDAKVATFESKKSLRQSIEKANQVSRILRERLANDELEGKDMLPDDSVDGTGNEVRAPESGAIDMPEESTPPEGGDEGTEVDED